MEPKSSQPTVVVFGEELLERVERSHQRVQERLDRACLALAQAAVPFALGGSNATAIWIASVDEGAVRGVRNVEIVLRRNVIEIATSHLVAKGFIPSIVDGQIRFLDGAGGKWREAVELTFAGEAVRRDSTDYQAPQPEEAVTMRGQRVLMLESLVAFQLARYRLDDAVDLRDMMDVGLIDQSWPAKFQPELGKRLQDLLDDPDG